MGNSTAGPAFRMGGPAFRMTEGRHSERPNAAIPKYRHSERPLFRNSAIPKLTFKAILSMNSASIPYIQHIKWKMRISSTPSNNVFIIFLPIMYIFTQKKQCHPYRSGIFKIWSETRVQSQETETPLSSYRRECGKKASWFRLEDCSTYTLIFITILYSGSFGGQERPPLYQLKD